jgi:purine-nucleoside phosphorylase
MPESKYLDLTPILAEIYKRVPAEFAPEIGIVCGSGLSDIAAKIENPITIQYSELPNFPHSQVVGHKNEVVFGKLGGKNVICFRGRFHYYEGWTVQQNTLGIRLMGALGVKLIFITNAAGGLPQEYHVGDVMLMDGHINIIGMVGVNPLIGPNDDTEGDRFPPVTAYDTKLNDLFAERYQVKAAETGHKNILRRGSYIGLTGPNYETPHEVQMLRTWGGHSVGMSTTNEIVVASHLGIKVVGLSLITNSCVGTEPADLLKGLPNHAEVIQETKKVEVFLQSLVADFISHVNLSEYHQSKIAPKYTRENLGKVCPATGQVGSEGECPGLKAQAAAAAAADAGCTKKCPFTCPISAGPTASNKHCPFMWSMLGAVVGAVIGIGATVAYAHAPLALARFNKDE